MRSEENKWSEAQQEEVGLSGSAKKIPRFCTYIYTTCVIGFPEQEERMRQSCIWSGNSQEFCKMHWRSRATDCRNTEDPEQNKEEYRRLQLLNIALQRNIKEAIRLMISFSVGQWKSIDKYFWSVNKGTWLVQLVEHATWSWGRVYKPHFGLNTLKKKIALHLGLFQ